MYRNVRVAVFGAPTTRTDRAMCELQRRGSQPVPDPVRHLPGWFPVHVAPRTAHGPAAHRTASARPRRRRWWRETVPVRPVRPELPLPFSVSQAPRTKPQGPLAGRQAVHVRHMRHAVQVSCRWRFYYVFFFILVHVAGVSRTGISRAKVWHRLSEPVFARPSNLQQPVSRRPIFHGVNRSGCIISYNYV